MCVIIFPQLFRPGLKCRWSAIPFGLSLPRSARQTSALLLSPMSCTSLKTSPGGRADWASWYSPASQMRQQDAEIKQMGPQGCWTDVICRQLCLLYMEYTVPQFANVTDELLLSLQHIVKNCLLLITRTLAFCSSSAVTSSSNEQA